MKLSGWTALACVAVLTIACDVRDRSRYDESTTITDSKSPAGTSGQAARAAGADAELFAKQAMMASEAEVKLGQLAAEHAQSPAVKNFAQMMVRDHTNGLNALKQAVKGHSIDEPSQLDAKHQAVYDRLSKLDGAEFDREYIVVMVEGHREVKGMIVDRVEQSPTAKGTSGGATDNSPLDASVNQWATKALPTVTQHLQKAEQIQSQLK